MFQQKKVFNQAQKCQILSVEKIQYMFLCQQSVESKGIDSAGLLTCCFAALLIKFINVRIYLYHQPVVHLLSCELFV